MCNFWAPGRWCRVRSGRYQQNHRVVSGQANDLCEIVESHLVRPVHVLDQEQARLCQALARHQVAKQIAAPAPSALWIHRLELGRKNRWLREI